MIKDAEDQTSDILSTLEYVEQTLKQVGIVLDEGDLRTLALYYEEYRGSIEALHSVQTDEEMASIFDAGSSIDPEGAR